MMSENHNKASKHVLKEQLRLFAFDLTSIPSPDVLTQIDQEMGKRERLATLLAGELNFHGESSGYASHDLHSFAAKFPPQIPRAFIRGLTKPGDYVLDPMMGSGTTVVEAILEGRKGIGLDIDPLAIRLAQVKTTPVNLEEIRRISFDVLSRAHKLLKSDIDIDHYLRSRFDAKSKEFIEYWFLPSTQRELAALILAIQEVTDQSIRRFLELTFSSIIVTKSGGVSRARDLAHSRPHLDIKKVPKNALDMFSSKLRKNLNSISELSQHNIWASTIVGDTRRMPIADEKIDLIVTSPPYANAIDYMRAHKFSLVWFGKSISELSELRSKYIGSERAGKNQYGRFNPRIEAVVNALAVRDKVKATVLRKYFFEMKISLSEMYRVLRKNSPAIIIVGTSLMRELDVQTHLCLADLAEETGFELVGISKRVLDRNKRMMPARFGMKSESMIEQRMHDEYVIGLLKPSE